ncbi:MAG: ABC transporter permease [Kofleriaceae bacterium]
MKLFDLDSWQEIFAVLSKHTLRTTLTALGVILGIFILLAMVGFGRAFEVGVTKEMSGFANNAIFLWGQTTTKPYSGLPQDRPIRFDNGDIAALTALPGVEHVAPRNQRGGFMGGSNVRYGTKTGGFQVSGDYPTMQYIMTPLMRAGRYLNDADIAERRKVCLIGEGVVEQLMARGENPIGKHLDVSGVYFEIIGVFGTKSTGNRADRILNTIHIPFTTFQQAFNLGDQVGWFAVTGQPDVPAEELEEQIRHELAVRHRFDPSDKQAVGSWNTGRQFRKISSLFSIIKLVLWIAGLMTLAAGVVGVSNIMLISVRERTKELGVRKALGANPREIVRMVVVEALVLTLAAGYVGVVLGVGMLEGAGAIISKLGDEVPLGPPDVGLGLAFGALGVLALFGALAGIIPAYHAASIQPVEALRTE